MAEDRVNDMLIENMNKFMTERVEEMIAEGKTEEEILEKLDAFDYVGVFKEMYDVMASKTTDTLENSMYERVLEQRAITAEFMAHNEQIWGKGFVASEAMHIIAVECAAILGKYLSECEPEKTKDFVYRYTALREIHGRSCQQFLEIVYLMKAGFADGAFARWRSMYELSVVALFIKEHEECVAEAYCAASNSTDTWHNWAKAAPCFQTKEYQNPKRNVTFGDIQKECSFPSDTWKAQYNLANNVVHASPQGTFGRLSNYRPTGVTPVGHGDYGILSAAENSAISLGLVTVLLLTLIPTGDGIVQANVIQKWVDIVRKHYLDAEQNCFSPNDPPYARRVDGSEIEFASDEDTDDTEE